MNMLALLRTWGTVLRRSWPELLAAYFVAAVAHRLLIQLSAWVYSYSQMGSFAVEPLAVLARLVGYVSMILIIRNSLPTLSSIAPQTYTSPADRRKSFINSILASILPFFAFYYAAGLFKEDHFTVVRIGTQIQIDRSVVAVVADEETIGSQEALVSVGWFSIAVVAVAFSVRAILRRFEGRLPRWTSLVSVYLEVIWVFMLISVIFEVRENTETWMEGRKGLAWLFNIGDWVAANLPVVATSWEALTAVLGAIVGLISVPLAWLTVVGVIYGQALSAQPLTMRARVFEQARTRYSGLNENVREGISFAVEKVAGETKGRLAMIYRAFTLMFRAGPVLFTGFVLLYQLWALGAAWLEIALPRIFGAMDLSEYAIMLTFFSGLAIALAEPLRIALVGAAYDSALTRTFDRSVAKAEKREEKDATNAPTPASTPAPAYAAPGAGQIGTPGGSPGGAYGGTAIPPRPPLPPVATGLTPPPPPPLPPRQG